MLHWNVERQERITLRGSSRYLLSVHSSYPLQGDLSIISTLLTDAGRLTCVEMDTTMRSSAELVVIGELQY
jgi:hypothetical protein